MSLEMWKRAWNRKGLVFYLTIFYIGQFYVVMFGSLL